MGAKMKIVSYYTLNTPYELEVRQLEKSLNDVGVDYIIRGLPARPTWVENCAQKSEFIQAVSAELNESFWWLDADAVLNTELPDLEDCDIAAHIKDGWRLMSGTVFFSNSPACKSIIDLWSLYCRQHPHVWDQVMLMIAIHNNNITENSKLNYLPEHFCKKKFKSRKEKISHNLKSFLNLTPKTIVLQNQLSRETKKELKFKNLREFSSDDLSDEVIQTLKSRSDKEISMSIFDS
ncbi:hypothetical protein [Roseibium polysiphoniae]|uniref:Nucleotide-diphospho-sugar transferase domain-containing protein n=1 Tax=Roseibium polysiphoniae TaxID=2571221 RepID=A0ABR9C7R1_9HYPH|nr:hypothetical protein [Roseibium polysiphoniae]MBD8874956.1 hypothetical protein [Roseibium polysiphoniae]